MVDHIHQDVLSWIDTAASVIKQSMNHPIEVEHKTSRRDVVTAIDRTVEEYFVSQIRKYYPEHRILGEEGMGDTVDSLDGYVWIIDPIDGTLNFVKSHNHFAMMIAIFHDGQPMAGYIYDVMHEDLYYAFTGSGVYCNDQLLPRHALDSLEESLIIGNVRHFVDNRYQMQSLLNASLGARAYGSAAIEIISLLRGEAGLYIACYLKPWDFAAGYILCQEMGLNVTQPDGSPIDLLTPSAVLFAYPAIHRQALELMTAT